MKIKSIFTKKGWAAVIVVILVLCTLRGLNKMLFHTGTFLEGFGYPLVLLAIISLITVPLFIIDYSYRDRPLPPAEPAPKWVTALKALGVIAYIPVVFLGGIGISDQLIHSLLIRSKYYVTNAWLAPVYFIGALYLFAVLVWLYGKHGILGNLLWGEDGLLCHLPSKRKTWVLIGTIGVYLLSFLCYTCCYDCFTFDGVERRIFGYTKSYTWEDVDHYTLQKAFDGTLSYIVVMRDGFHSDCLSGTVSTCRLPKDRFPNEQEDYCLYLTQLFREKEIPLEHTDFEKLENKLSYDYWKEYLKKLQKTEGSRN